MMFTTMTRLARPAAARQLTKQVPLPVLSRTFVSPTGPVLLSSAATPSDSLPYHIVIGMPALSPTMDSGALAEWHIAEGDSFIAGDALAKIDTDKASMDFEAQDDGYVAKILIPAGNGEDIPVGTPMFITVEEEDFLAAFKDYVHVVEAEAPPVVAEPAAPAAPVVAPVAPAPVVAAAAPPAPVAAPPAPAPAPVPTPAATTAAPVNATASAAGIATAWGLHAKTASPLAKTLRAQQTTYTAKYGTTGQQTL